MPKNLRFWLNVMLISAAHVVVIAGLVRWSREPKSPNAQSVLWMGGSAGEKSSAKSVAKPTSAKTSVPEPKQSPHESDERDDENPILTSAKSEIQLPTPKPSPTSSATPKPSPSPKVKVTPRPPKPKPTPTATAKPKPSPKKMVVAKAVPKPSPKAKPTPEPSPPKEDVDLKKNEPAPEQTLAPAKETSLNSGRVGNGGGHAGGGSGQSQFGWYGSMLHDRFYSEWVQPSSLASSGAKNSVLVKMRIEKDGRVSNFEIIKPSGNAAVDESVSAVAKRVTQVDPLPAGLGNGEHYDVKINFELNSE
jgi:TonB family protein